MGGVGGDHAAGIENRCAELCLSRLTSPFVAGSTHSSMRGKTHKLIQCNALISP
jgi:hypothetical protein